MAARYGEEIGWVLAGDLMPGDIVSDIDGAPALKVVSNRLEKTSETVYNFEVAGTHSYFADELGLWVHNPSDYKNQLLRTVEFFRLQGKCPMCGSPMRRFTPMFGSRGNCFSFDHRIRQRSGGADTIDNLRGMCISCNSRRG